MNVTSMNMTTGAFLGTGFYNPVPAYTWNVTGSVSGSGLIFTIVYTGLNPGYTVNAAGTIALDGTLSGTATGPGQTFSWASTTGNATPLIGPPTDKNQCKKNGWKAFNNPTFKNQGDCVSFVASGGKAKGNP